MITLQDGTGTGNLVKVTSANRLVTSSVTLSAAADATVDGDSQSGARSRKSLRIGGLQSSCASADLT